ncbi:hypothetical protein D3879_03475 [Pseudomonas cavernicola]|uniref:Uncharacterized protein n=1 Tax=Pseudomonas cavernicola TaxID=2320866 RepID=A0A418XIR0_9PSED|nr:hypothetical protein [Pseudomonas cavernicola]RJG12368.1 hypothetical protein D3879_03475 [Pseudomonas cavernicola]
MNTGHPRFTSALLALAGIVGSLIWESASAAPSPARQTSQLIVPIEGTLDGATENIALKGQARIRSTMFTDPDFDGPPGVILSIDFLNVIGVGQSTGARYFAHGENTVVRPLRPSDLVELTFPITPVNANATESARPVLASFTLTFDVDNGQLRAAIANFSTPSF